jgi:hypothetical protein
MPAFAAMVVMVVGLFTLTGRLELAQTDVHGSHVAHPGVR